MNKKKFQTYIFIHSDFASALIIKQWYMLYVYIIVLILFTEIIDILIELL